MRHVFLTLLFVFPVLLLCLLIANVTYDTFHTRESPPVSVSRPNEATREAGRYLSELPPLPACSEHRSGYCVLSYHPRAWVDVDPTNNMLTYATQVTLNDLWLVSQLCERWQGPISVSAYLPGKDLNIGKQIIHNLRTVSECVRNFISWHLIYDLDHPPEDTVVLEDSRAFTVNGSYREEHGLLYPINLARNVARMNAQTKFILQADVDLCPSENFANFFLMKFFELGEEGSQEYFKRKQVFIVPIFEVNKTQMVPQSKDELIGMVKRQEAIWIPREGHVKDSLLASRSDWLKSTVPCGEGISLFLTTDRPEDWGPFLICTNRNPLEDETFKTERASGNSYAVNLPGYEAHVLDGVFLAKPLDIRVNSVMDWHINDDDPYKDYYENNHYYE